VFVSEDKLVIGLMAVRLLDTRRSVDTLVLIDLNVSCKINITVFTSKMWVADVGCMDQLQNKYMQASSHKLPQ
jgi:hypothetical protein